jgi:hypothetical protein
MMPPYADGNEELEGGVVEVENRPLTSEEQFYLSWSRESPKLNLALTRDLLGRLVTLSSALAAGSLAFLKDIVPPEFIVCTFGVFLLSLLFSLLGILPLRENVEDTANEIKKSKAEMLEKKLMWLWLSAVALFVGFWIVLLGMFVKFASG